MPGAVERLRTLLTGLSRFRDRVRGCRHPNDAFPEVAGDVLMFKAGRKVCCKRFMVVKGLSTSLLEMGAADLLSFARGYLRTLNMGFPIEFRSFVIPLDKDMYLRDLEKRISTLEVILESNPTAPKVKAKLEELRKVRDHIVKHGLPPLGLIALIMTEACGESSEEALAKVRRQSQILKNTLSSLGIRVEETGGIGSELLKRIFFRRSPRSRPGGVAGYLVRRMYAKVFVGLTALLLQPFVLSGDLLSNVRSGGIYLGRDPESGEKLFWDARSSLSPHVLVVGPTGSGKTEFLALLATRIQRTYGVGGIILDVKGEYAGRLRRRGAGFVELKPGENLRLDLRDLSELLPPGSRAGMITDLISRAYPGLQKRELLSILYRAAERSLIPSCRSIIGCIRRYVELEGGSYEAYSVNKALSEVSTLTECSGTSLTDVVLEHVINRAYTLSILNLSRVSSISHELVDFTIYYLSRCVKAVTTLVPPSSNVFDLRTVFVLDEGWIYISRLSTEISSLMRLSRSYGVMICIATQSVSDLRKLGDSVLNNVGLLVALASPDKSYWRSLSDYVRIPECDVNRYTALLGRGEGIVRMSPDPRPRLVSFKG